MKIGISAISYDVAPLFLSMHSLAIARNLDAEKLEKGLGLMRCTFADTYQDSVVFGANAITRLITDNGISLADVARIYVGSESGIDNSKPIASYISGLLEQKFGSGCLSHCDAVDFTFACIGAVDALENCVNYIKNYPDKKAIVIATDIAKYDLNSAGEYTQGAGAVALLIEADPKILAFEPVWACSHKSTFDFFKPYVKVSKETLSNDLEFFDTQGITEKELELHREQPVFDGQYSNECYKAQIKEAYFRFKKLSGIETCLYEQWNQIIMHLPYAFQGRRMLTELFALDAPNPILDDAQDYDFQLKTIAKSKEYLEFVDGKLRSAEKASSLIGNLYTGSIFMALLSALVVAFESDREITGKKFGFMAYGSGSKSKIFEAIIQPEWKNAIQNQKLFETIESATEIDFETYLKLHTKEQTSAVKRPESEWYLDKIETQIPNLKGARYYKWAE